MYVASGMEHFTVTPLHAGVSLRRLGNGIISPLALPRVIATYQQPNLIAQLMLMFKQGPNMRLPVAYCIVNRNLNTE